MKKIGKFLFAIIFIFYSCSSDEKGEEESQEEYFIGLTNTITQSRKNEPIVIPRSLLEELTTVFPAGTVPVIFDEDGEEVPIQIDDLDGDGSWDEISFIYPILPTYTAPLKIDMKVASQASNFRKRTNVVIYQPDDENNSETSKPTSSTSAIGWENDKIAFKLQHKPEKEMEIIGKRTERMILNKRDFEQQRFMVRSRGKRLFHESDSLSPGTIAFMVDSVYHKIENYDSVNHQIIIQGPVRSIFNIIYKGVKIKNKKFDLEEKITIWARQEGYRNSISILNFEEELTFAAAVANSGTDSLAFNDLEGQYQTIAFYNFKENDDLEALGIILPQGHHFYPDSTMLQQNEDVYIPFVLSENNSLELYYFFGWQGEDKYYKDPDEFHSMLDKEVNRLKNPIEINRFIPE